MTGSPRNDVAGWRKVLAANTWLSSRFRDRYSLLLAEAAGFADDERQARATALAVGNPQLAVAVLMGTEQRAPAGRRTWTIVRHGTSADAVGKLLSEGDLDQVLERYPDLEQSWVPLHPDRQAKTVEIDGRRLAALRWPVESVHHRQAHHDRMAALVADAAQRAEVAIRVWDDYTVAAADADHVWAVTDNLGVTVEDEMRDLRSASQRRATLVRAIAALREAMVDHGLIWQGFAPRNMFFRDEQLLLIDFEEIVDTAVDPVRAAECLLWHRVFFADVLTEDEKHLVFAREPGFASDLDPTQTLPTDPFEAALLGTPTLTWATRAGLLHDSARLEAAHRRPTTSPRGALLFGHEIGHFWGDFVTATTEAAIFRALTAVSDPRQLCALLELFEAAMEADILRLLRSRAAGSPDMSTPYTNAMTECLTDRGATALAALRSADAGWYRKLAADPRRLCDRILFSANSAEQADPQVFLGVPGHQDTTLSALTDVIRLGTKFAHRAGVDEPVVRYATPDDLRQLLSSRLPEDGCDFTALLDDTERTVVDWSILQSHPGYLAFPDSANSLAATAGTLLAKLLNQNLITVDRGAPAATFVEIQTIAWLRELVGYPVAELTAMRGVKDVGGLWSTGGHLSNHVAMLAALGHHFPDVRRDGLAGLDPAPAVIMAGPIAHYSHSDAAFHLGLGWNAILSVDARPGYTTDVDAVEKALANPPAGRMPFMVIGVAGNCRTTGLDDLKALAEVCQRHGVWFHVDACHGGSLIFNSRLRERHLGGLAHADSISLDPHKGLFTPYPSSYVLFRNPAVLTQFSRHEAIVTHDDCWDLGLITPFLGSRGFESLATWMMLRHIGTRRLGALIEQRQALVRHVARRIDANALFIALNDVDFYRVAFVLCPPQARAIIANLPPDDRRWAALAVSTFTSELNTTLYQQGTVCFDEHTLADLGNRIGAGDVGAYTVMAACPGSPTLTMADIDKAVDRLISAARPAAAQLVAHLRSRHPNTSGRRHGGPAGWSDA